MHYLDIVTRIDMYISGWLISDDKMIANENSIPLEMPLDIGFSLTGLLPMHCVINTSIQSKLSISGTKPYF